MTGRQEYDRQRTLDEYMIKLLPVLRIRNVYPESRMGIFPSRIKKGKKYSGSGSGSA
jgi:hypothetical protein